LVSFQNVSAQGTALMTRLALRTVIRELSPHTDVGTLACSKLVPKLVAQLDKVRQQSNHTADMTDTVDEQKNAASEDTILGSTELLSDIFARFDATIQAHTDFQRDALKVLVPLLDHPRPAVRKRVTDALGLSSI
jgi:cullin-associated NEDD8-dissociated protein 1